MERICRLPSFSCFLLSIVFGFLVLFSISAHAETKYVSGVIVVNLRDTYTKDFKTLATVETGEQVQILEEKGHFAKVKTKDNIEGWIPIQYLRNDVPAAETIAKLKEQIATLQKGNERTAPETITGATDEQKKSYEQTIDSLKSDNSHLLEDNKRLLKLVQNKSDTPQPSIDDNKETEVLQQKVISLQNQLDTLSANSKNIIAITKERDRSAAEVVSLQTELVKIRQINKTLETDRMLHWFLAGAAVFFLGFLSSKLFTRKKSKLSF